MLLVVEALLPLLPRGEEMVWEGRGRGREKRMVSRVGSKKEPRMKCVACYCALSFRGVCCSGVWVVVCGVVL